VRGGEDLAPLLGQVQGVDAAVGLAAPALDETVALESVDELHDHRPAQGHLAGQALLRARPDRVERGQHGEAVDVEAERLQRLVQPGAAVAVARSQQIADATGEHRRQRLRAAAEQQRAQQLGEALALGLGQRAQQPASISKISGLVRSSARGRHRSARAHRSAGLGVAAALDEPGALEPVDDADHHRAVDAQHLAEPLLGQRPVLVEDRHHAPVARMAAAGQRLVGQGVRPQVGVTKQSAQVSGE
jgi:hypothetical protein